MVLGRIADGIVQGVEGATSGVTGLFTDPVVRLGVTGLARAGKTVFITSLVANLLDRGRMPGLRGAASGAIRAAWLQPQPDDTVPRFGYERHLNALTGQPPAWPESTRAVSQLRLSFKVQSSGMLGALSGLRTVHLDIVDYPGEWLLDLGLMEQDYATWSASVLSAAAERREAAAFLARLQEIDASQKLAEPAAEALAATYTDYLRQARKAGYSDCTPGRFLMPGELDGSPALTFAPLPAGPAPRGSLAREMARRFEAYKSGVIRPFFREHFARIDRQVVLVDLLDAIHAGPRALADLGTGLNRTLQAFRPGRASWLGQLLGQRRVERVLLAATKADHLHHLQHQAMSDILAAMLRQAKDRAEFAGAKTEALSLAALRATVEEERLHGGETLPMVRGTLLDGRQAAMYPGRLPDDPARLLTAAANGAERWLDGDYSVMRFLPPGTPIRAGEGPPHIRLDKAAEFLIGDKLR
ncbi:MAG: YcjX family protein [Pseudomonadota bacterium]